MHPGPREQRCVWASQHLPCTIDGKVNFDRMGVRIAGSSEDSLHKYLRLTVEEDLDQGNGEIVPQLKKSDPVDLVVQGCLAHDGRAT
jgi:hypothetical protein